MAEHRKLGRPTDQRKAMLRGLSTALVWNGSIVTTQARAKEVSSIVEKLVTLAVKEYDNSVVVEKQKIDADGSKTTIKVKNDLPSKLAARRKMMEWLYQVPHDRLPKESKMDFNDRTKENQNPVIEKMFREYGPKFAKRAEEKGPGGYTRIIKMGPRRGDAAEMVILEFVKQ